MSLFHDFHWTSASLWNIPDSKAHGANMRPIGGRQDPGGPMLAPWTLLSWIRSLQLGPDLATLSERQLNNEIHYFTQCEHAGSKKQTHEPTDLSWNIARSGFTHVHSFAFELLTTFLTQRHATFLIWLWDMAYRVTLRKIGSKGISCCHRWCRADDAVIHMHDSFHANVASYDQIPYITVCLLHQWT